VTRPRIHWITSDDPPSAFPPADTAFAEPNGLLAAGGDLSAERLLYAYENGIFPWYEDGQPILWWSPDPRCVIYPQRLAIPNRSLRAIRNCGFTLSFNRAFDDVIEACAAIRPRQGGTWITGDMKVAYRGLRRRGWAHSIEVWQHDRLVGGMYGLAIGRAFFGESMFSKVSNASKAAMLALCKVLVAKNFALVDCQVDSPHLVSLGADLIPRTDFLGLLEKACRHRQPFAEWPDETRQAGEFLTAGALQ
jgi:leucyl/phenylalanyl-tRNA--protein transferase